MNSVWEGDPAERRAWSLRFALCSALVLLSMYPPSFVRIFSDRLRDGGNAMLCAVVALQLAYVFGGQALLILLGKRWLGSWAAMGLASPRKGWKHLLIVGGVCGIVALIFSIAMTSLSSLGAAWVPRMSIAAISNSEGTLFAAFWEELVFRGLLYGLARRFSKHWIAATLSSAVFAAAHPLHAWPMVFVGGLFFAHVYVETGSIFGATFAHFLYNTPLRRSIPG